MPWETIDFGGVACWKPSAPSLAAATRAKIQVLMGNVTMAGNV